MTAPNNADISQYSVVMVDDDGYVLRALARIFRFEPYRVVTADSGQEGLRILSETDNVAVILTDQRMPEMSGTEFLLQSKEFAPAAVKILLTGYSDRQATINAIGQGGAACCISKPWDEAVLIETVRTGVRKYMLHQGGQTILHHQTPKREGAVHADE